LQAYRYRVGVRQLDFDATLAPYPEHSLKQWQQLSGFVTQAPPQFLILTGFSIPKNSISYHVVQPSQVDCVNRKSHLAVFGHRPLGGQHHSQHNVSSLPTLVNRFCGIIHPQKACALACLLSMYSVDVCHPRHRCKASWCACFFTQVGIPASKHAHDPDQVHRDLMVTVSKVIVQLCRRFCNACGLPLGLGML
jgi:hypothetical protein